MSENCIHRNLSGRPPRVTRPCVTKLFFAVLFVSLGLGVSTTDAETTRRDLQPTSAASVDAATKRLLEDAEDRHFDRHSLLEAALIAEGAHDWRVFDDCNECLRRHQRRLRTLDVAGASPKQRARIVHQFMHAEMLTGGYNKHSTSVAGALRSGSFNCVSSSILFRCLCSELGLKTRVVETSGHVWMRIVGPQRSADLQTVDVQTTVARWQDATQRDPQHKVRTSDAAHKPSKARRPGREVGELELVAMIFYNRGVDLLHQRNYVAAARMNCIALALDPPNRSARANLLASLNNRSVQLTEQEEFVAAREVLLRGLSVDGRYASLLDNDLYLHHQWITSLCRRVRFAEALEVLNAAQKRRGEEPFFRQTRLQVCRRWAERLLTEGSLDEALALFDSERHQGVDVEALRQVESDAINDRAVELAEQQRLGEAIELLELAIRRGGDRPLLKKNHRKALEMLRREARKAPTGREVDAESVRGLH